MPVGQTRQRLRSTLPNVTPVSLTEVGRLPVLIRMRGVREYVRRWRIERSTKIVIEHSMVIQRPTEEVFVFVADLDNWAQPTSPEKGRTYHSPVEAGDRFRQTIEVSGQRIELLGEVVDYELNERLSFEYTWDSSSLGIVFVFEPVNGGTRLTAKGEVQVRGFFLKMFEPVVEREVNREMRSNLDKIKSLLGSRASGDARHLCE